MGLCQSAAAEAGGAKLSRQAVPHLVKLYITILLSKSSTLHVKRVQIKTILIYFCNLILVFKFNLI